MAIERFIISIFTAIVGLFLVYVLITSFATIIPGFAIFGWLLFIVIFIAVILGILTFIKQLF